MRALFTKSFFRFASGFAGIIAIGVLGVFIIGANFEDVNNQAQVDSNIPVAE